MGGQDHDPHPDGGKGGDRSDEDEDVLGNYGVQDDADQEDPGHHHYRHPGHAVPGYLAEGSGSVALPGEAEEDAARAKDIAVDSGESRCDHHRVQDVRCCRDAQPAEDLDEGAAVAADFIPREEAHEHSQRQDVEQQDTHRDGIDCLGDDHLRVRGLAGRDAQRLDTAKGEHHHGEGCQQAFESEREEAAMVHEVSKARRSS
jgi:hypothetical protein